MNCCGKDRKRPVREISDQDSKSKKRNISIIPVIAVIAIAIIIYYSAV